MPNRYVPEHLLLALVMAISVAGFWDIYLSADASPTGYHHLHLATIAAWLVLLVCQLRLVATQDYRRHRTVGMSVLVLAPLLVASAALLSVHSAHKGLVSGQGDFLIVQNVMGTLELGLLILLAFVVRKRRQLHGALLLSTTITFMGIALFFALISFVPAFRIEGPETLDRFAKAAITGQGICLVVGLFFFFRDWRTGWPYLLAAFFFGFNEAIKVFLSVRGGLETLTQVVGSVSPTWTFVGSLVGFTALLLATGMASPGRGRSAAA